MLKARLTIRGTPWLDIETDEALAPSVNSLIADLVEHRAASILAGTPFIAMVPADDATLARLRTLWSTQSIVPAPSEEPHPSGLFPDASTGPVPETCTVPASTLDDERSVTDKEVAAEFLAQPETEAKIAVEPGVDPADVADMVATIQRGRKAAPLPSAKFAPMRATGATIRKWAGERGLANDRDPLDMAKINAKRNDLGLPPFEMTDGRRP